MPGTKILNVQKNDSFEEVLDAFTSAEAKEVIFIFPKGTPFARNADYFQGIKNEAVRSGKLVNIMSSDPIIVQLAKGHNFGILQNPAPRRRPAYPKTILANEPIAQLSADNLENTYFADLAAARKKKFVAMPPEESGKRIKDIIAAVEHQELEVQESEEKEEPIEISRTPLIPTKPSGPAEAPKVLSEHIAPVQQPAVNDIEKLWEEEEKRRDPEAILESKPKRKGFGTLSKKFILIPLAGALVVLGVVLYTTLGHAKVIIKPHTQDINFKLKVTAAASVESVQPEFNKIPGQQFSVDKEAEGSYPSTSQKEVAQKATGKIKIYNTSKESQRLVATTRFSTKDGLIFRIPETITVPASSSIESVVYADRTGKEYNIGPSRFTIPGFEGTPRYDLFYATSSAPMIGGIVGMAKVVAEQDYLKAKEELSNKAKEEVLAALKEQLGDLTIFEPVEVIVSPPTANAKAGEAADTLNMSVRASVSVIAYRTNDLEALIQAYLNKSGNMDLIKENLDLSFTLITSDTTAKSVQFETTVKGRAAAHIDTDKILSEIQGKNEEGIRAYFEGIQGVDSTRILLSPFWVTKVPRDAKKIELSIDRS